jgi:hypothetical protein
MTSTTLFTVAFTSTSGAVCAPAVVAATNNKPATVLIHNAFNMSFPFGLAARAQRPLEQ